MRVQLIREKHHTDVQNSLLKGSFGLQPAEYGIVRMKHTAFLRYPYFQLVKPKACASAYCAKSVNIGGLTASICSPVESASKSGFISKSARKDCLTIRSLIIDCTNRAQAEFGSENLSPATRECTGVWPAFSDSQQLLFRKKPYACRREDAYIHAKRLNPHRVHLADCLCRNI